MISILLAAVLTLSPNSTLQVGMDSVTEVALPTSSSLEAANDQCDLWIAEYGMLLQELPVAQAQEDKLKKALDAARAARDKASKALVDAQNDYWDAANAYSAACTGQPNTDACAELQAAVLEAATKMNAAQAAMNAAAAAEDAANDAYNDAKAARSTIETRLGELDSLLAENCGGEGGEGSEGSESH